jgi:hypothetical protein
VGSTREGIAEILATYRAQGIRRIVALRGDLPSGTAVAGEFRYAAELVRFIRETQGRDWHIEVAAYPEYHPEQRYARRDLQHFADKVAAGAERPSRSSSSTPTPTSTSWTRCGRWVSPCRSCRASCRSTTTRDRAVRGSATASRSRAGWR